MPVTIPFAALRQMSQAEARDYWTPRSSAELPEALASGILRDTADVSTWLFWARLRN